MILCYIDRLVQGRRNSIANALELRLSRTNPAIYDVQVCNINCIPYLNAIMITYPYPEVNAVML